MSSSFTASLGLVSNEARPLVARGALRPPAAHARPQVDTRATALAADDATWTEFVADQPRIQGTAGRLLIEGQHANAVRNPRAEGAVAPSTLPTHWSLGGAATTTNGLGMTIIGRGTDSGIDYVTVELAGTTTNTNGGAINLETGTGIVAAAGETWTGAVFVALEPGFAHAMPNGNFQFRLYAHGAASADHTGANFTPTETWQRVRVSRLLPSGTTSLQPRIRYGATATGAVISTRWRIGWPAVSRSTFASTPILPPIGTRSASTRGADLVTAPLASLGIGGNGACTLLWSGMVPQAAPAGINQTLLQIDGGGDADRIVLRMAAGGTGLFAVPVTGGVAGTAASAGSVTAGVPFRIGLALNGAGRIAVSLNGAAAAVALGAPVSGLNTLRLGNDAAGTGALFGETAMLRTRPFALPDAALAAAVAALPG